MTTRVAVIRIECTKCFQSGARRAPGAVDLSQELAGMLRAWKKSGSGGFIITSRNLPRYETSRTNYLAQREFLALGEWLAEQGISARKKLHALHKEYGTIIANGLSILAVSRALRHADIRITSEYYTGRKVRVTTGSDALLT